MGSKNRYVTFFMLRVVGLWGLFLVLAILNATLREKLVSPILGQSAALLLGGGILCLFIFLATLTFIPRFGIKSPNSCWSLRVLWVFLTLAFEFLFGHYGMGKGWSEILQILNLARGNLMLLVLFTTAISLYLPWRVRA